MWTYHNNKTIMPFLYLFGLTLFMYLLIKVTTREIKTKRMSIIINSLNICLPSHNIDHEGQWDWDGTFVFFISWYVYFGYCDILQCVSISGRKWDNIVWLIMQMYANLVLIYISGWPGYCCLFTQRKEHCVKSLPGRSPEPNKGKRCLENSINSIVLVRFVLHTC